MGDLLDIIEAAYMPEADDERWLSNVMHAARCLGPCYARMLRRERVGGPVSTLVSTHDPEMLAPLRALDTISLARLSPHVVWAIHLPSPPVEQARDREARLGRALELGDEWFDDAIGARPEPPVSFYRAFTTATGICAGDPEGERAMVIGMMDRGSPLSPRERGALNRLSAHFGAALRMRTLAQRADAVLTRKHLRKVRSTSPTDAIRLWKAMIRGRWSLVESVERDGKRYLLARRNPPRVRDIRALTPTQCAVLGYAALGHSNKHIGYELGLAPTTVASHLGAGLRKLGIRSRSELIRQLGPLGA